jgi:hypothetical protein
MLRLVPFIAVAALLLGAPAAQATVLVNAPYPFVKRCGARITLGVWHRADGVRGSRRVTMLVRTPSGRTLWRRHVTATGRWRYWTYRPACGRRYVVRYVTAGGTQDFRLRVRR